MESGSLGMSTSSAIEPRVQSDCSLAVLRRRAWAQSKDSTWPESEAEKCGPQGPQQNQKDGEEQRPSEAPGQVPNNITSWLNECRTPIGASLDDQSASPSRGVLKNGCSFEDDLSLGAEANHLQSSNNTAESCFGLAAHQKRSQYKERTRSMNSTGSGKSSTVSSVSEVLEQSVEHPEETLLTLRVSELLDLYEEDPEEILLNLGFGREEPDLASKVPSRFFNNSSIARGIDIKVYLGAQLQRMEVENPNYALTSRFRQIEVLTTVANEFFQLYSQVSGNPVQRISSKDQGGEAVEGDVEESSPSLKRTSSARNVAKFLKKTITKRNLLAAASESPEAHTPNQHTQLNGHAASDHSITNGHTHTDQEPDGCSTDPDHQAETVNQKHMRKKDSCSLATVTEETNGDGDESPEQSRTRPEASEERPPTSADCQSANERTEEGTQVVKDEQEQHEEQKNLTSTPEKPPPTLAPLQLAQLRTEKTDSFDMEEIQSNEDEPPPPRTSRAADLLRTVSQQSDSSGFAEDPSADSNSYLKVQESCDSCDSETTVTSHPSLDVATPLAMDQPAFELPGGREEEAGPSVAAEADGRSSPRREDEHDGSSEQVPRYIAHHLPRMQQDETQEEKREQVESGERTDPEQEIMPAAEQNPQSDLENTQSQSAAEKDLQLELENANQSAAGQKLQSELQNTQLKSVAEQELQHPQKQTDTATESPTEEITTVGVTAEGVTAEAEAQDEHASLDSGPLCPTLPPSSAVLCALMRAKQKQVTQGGQRGRRIRLQRSSSLPCSFSSPSRVVSSVKILFGRGQASCTQPTYSFKYTQEAEGDEEEEEEEKRQTNCRSTLIINPSSSSDPSNQPRQLPTEAPIPPKPIPRYLLPSVSSQQSCSPPPDWPSGSHVRSWSTRSVPDLSSNLQRLGHFQQNMSPNQNQQSWNPGQSLFQYPNPKPTAQYLNPSPNPSPSFNPSPYPFNLNPPPLYAPSRDPYTSVPNLLHHQNLSHHSSLTGFYQPPPTIPQQGSLSNLHQPSTSTSPHHSNLGYPYLGTPAMHHQGYNHLYGHQSPYHTGPHSSPLASPYPGYHGYCMNPHQPYPHPVTQCPPLVPEHNHHLGFPPPAPGFFPGLATSLGPDHNLHPGLAPHAAPTPAAPNQGPSSTEMQLRRVLHDIRGMVQSLGQNRGDTLGAFSEHRATNTSHQTLAEFQQRKKSLSFFRSQMTDLEQSIVQQQALVYKHLSPSDRIEVEQLQSLRSAVREELQQLEHQLEDRMIELTHHTQHRDLHRDSNVDSLSSSSALRAMEPVSDLLREQLFLQSELSFGGHALSTATSSRSSSPVRGGGGNGEKEGGVYRASINITPVPPPRPNTRNEEEEEEGKKDKEGAPEEQGAAGGVSMGSLQQLIREIRESVTQEVRQEIYNELLAAVSPRRSPQPGRQHPL